MPCCRSIVQMADASDVLLVRISQKLHGLRRLRLESFLEQDGGMFRLTALTALTSLAVRRVRRSQEAGPQMGVGGQQQDRGLPPGRSAHSADLACCPVRWRVACRCSETGGASLGGTCAAGGCASWGSQSIKFGSASHQPCRAGHAPPVCSPRLLASRACPLCVQAPPPHEPCRAGQAPVRPARPAAARGAPAAT